MVTPKKNKHRGSNFHDFLREEGIYEECRAGAIKKIIAHELELEMQKHNISQEKMAELLGTSKTAVRRILDPKNASITLLTINKVASVLGKDVDLKFISRK